MQQSPSENASKTGASARFVIPRVRIGGQLSLASDCRTVSATVLQILEVSTSLLRYSALGPVDFAKPCVSKESSELSLA